MKKNKKKVKFRQKYRDTINLTLLFTLSYGLLLTLTLLTVIFITYHIYKSPLFNPDHIPPHFQIYLFAFFSTIIGFFLAVICSRFIIRPIKKIIKALNKITEGDYSVRISEKGFLRYTSLAKNFNIMADELAGVETSQAEFINNFSHEFKTPISSMLGFAKLLKKDNISPEERAEFVDIIISESERLTDLSSNVLTLSKIEKQSILTDAQIFNLSEQLRRIVSLLDGKITQKNIDIIFEGNDVYINANKNMLTQVWINIIDNAVKFSPEGSEIKISVYEENNLVIVGIKDNGIGISEDMADKIFDRFYQGDPSHTTKGYGLGLTIAKKIVELHQGQITLTSSAGKGSLFQVYLPK